MVSIVSRVSKMTGQTELELLTLWEDCVNEATEYDPLKQNSLTYSRAARRFLEKTGVRLSVSQAKAVDVKDTETANNDGV